MGEFIHTCNYGDDKQHYCDRRITITAHTPTTTTGVGWTLVNKSDDPITPQGKGIDHVYKSHVYKQ